MRDWAEKVAVHSLATVPVAHELAGDLAPPKLQPADKVEVARYNHQDPRGSVSHPSDYMQHKPLDYLHVYAERESLDDQDHVHTNGAVSLFALCLSLGVSSTRLSLSFVQQFLFLFPAVLGPAGCRAAGL